MDRERAEMTGDRRPASTSAEGRSSNEIRRDIETTRADLHETVGALERKLSPGQLLDEIWGKVKSGDGGGVGSVVRDHPVPLALMGLGVAWLAIEQMTGSPGDDLRRRHGSVGPGTYEPAEGRVGPYGGEAATGHEEGSSLKDKAKEAARSAKHKAEHAADEAKGWAGERAESLRATADDAGGTARYRAHQAKRGFREALDDYPLAMGAVAFGLGLASGLSAPSSRLEDRAMGDASDTVKGEAKRAAKDVAESAQAVAADAASAAKDEADRQDVVGDVKESAKRAKDEVTG